MLEDATMTKLRDAIQERMADPSGSRDPLTRAIAGMAAEARERGMTAEDMVISIKREWDEMLDVGLVPHGLEHSRLKDSIVTSAIKAYYVQQ